VINILLQQVLIVWVIMHCSSMEHFEGGKQTLLNCDQLASVMGTCDEDGGLLARLDGFDGGVGGLLGEFRVEGDV
jgi:hypothetical protein